MNGLCSRMFRWPALLLLLALLSACGFHLRGGQSAQLPYASLYVDLPRHSEIGVALRRYIAATGNTRVAERREEAEAVFQQVSDTREKAILSLNASGQVREYRLQTRYRFRIVDKTGRQLVPVNEINLSRDVTFSDSAILAKEQEEALLWRDINSDLLGQILRRLSIVKPKLVVDEE